MNIKTKEYLIEKLKSGDITFNSTTKIWGFNEKETFVDQEGKSYKIISCYYDYIGHNPSNFGEPKRQVLKDKILIKYQKNSFKVFVFLKEVKP